MTIPCGDARLGGRIRPLTGPCGCPRCFDDPERMWCMVNSMTGRHRQAKRLAASRTRRKQLHRSPLSVAHAHLRARLCRLKTAKTRSSPTCSSATVVTRSHRRRSRCRRLRLVSLPLHSRTQSCHCAPGLTAMSLCQQPTRVRTKCRSTLRDPLALRVGPRCAPTSMAGGGVAFEHLLLQDPLLHSRRPRVGRRRRLALRGAELCCVCDDWVRLLHVPMSRGGCGVYSAVPSICKIVRVPYLS